MKETACPVTVSDARKVAFGAFIGTALEWNDFFPFGKAASLVFNRLYASDDPVVATTSATGSASSAPVAGCRGQRRVGRAVTLAVEHAPKEHRGRYAAMPQIGSLIGTLLASGAFLAVSYLPAQSFDAWGWRLPFRGRAGQRPRSRYRGARVATTAGRRWLGVPRRRRLLPDHHVRDHLRHHHARHAERLAERYGPDRITLLGGLASVVVAFPAFWLIDTTKTALITASCGVLAPQISSSRDEVVTR